MDMADDFSELRSLAADLMAAPEELSLIHI